MVDAAGMRAPVSTEDANVDFILSGCPSTAVIATSGGSSDSERRHLHSRVDSSSSAIPALSVEQQQQADIPQVGASSAEFDADSMFACINGPNISTKAAATAIIFLGRLIIKHTSPFASYNERGPKRCPNVVLF